MKMASMGYCVLVFGSSGETAAHPEDSFPCLPAGSRKEFEVGRAASCDELPSFVKSPPKGCALRL